MADSKELCTDSQMLEKDDRNLRCPLKKVIVSLEPKDLKRAHKPEEDTHEKENGCPIEPWQHAHSTQNHIQPWIVWDEGQRYGGIGIPPYSEGELNDEAGKQNPCK